jgi:hypothetical protein
MDFFLPTAEPLLRLLKLKRGERGMLACKDGLRAADLPALGVQASAPRSASGGGGCGCGCGCCSCGSLPARSSQLPVAPRGSGVASPSLLAAS